MEGEPRSGVVAILLTLLSVSKACKAVGDTTPTLPHPAANRVRQVRIASRSAFLECDVDLFHRLGNVAKGLLMLFVGVGGQTLFRFL